MLGPANVVEWGCGVAAAQAAKMLADSGMVVVRVLDRNRPTDPHRDQDPGVRAYFDRGKRCVELDSSTPEGRASLRELLVDADVLIEDQRPRDVEAMEMDFPRLSRSFPSLIVASITPFGWTGPYRDLRATDSTIAFMAGLSWLMPRDVLKQGDGSGQPPLKMPGSLVSTYAGISAAGSVLAALRLRRRTARGHHVDVAVVETLIPTLRREIALYLYEDVVASRFMRVWRLAPYGVKRCRDGYVFLQVVEPHHWRGLSEMMGSPEWAMDPRYADGDYRYEHRQEIEEKMAPWLARQAKADLAWQAQQRSLPFAAVNVPRDLAHVPQLVSRGFFEPYADAVTSARLFPGQPYRRPAHR
jgi:crotonobetainyl-CoA:carnitine CoA-transferase CaiB-like acyl-CoA transferase